VDGGDAATSEANFTVARLTTLDPGGLRPGRARADGGCGGIMFMAGRREGQSVVTELSAVRYRVERTYCAL
jgi:hypothetical protein